MFNCISCGREGNLFNLEVAERTEPVFTYRAKCPRCGSTMVNALPGPHEEDLRIFAWEPAEPVVESRQCKKHGQESHLLMVDGTWLCLRCRLESE